MNSTMDRSTAQAEEPALDFQLEILDDASRAATTYWRNHLWRFPHDAYRPSPSIYARFGEKYGTGGIEAAWAGWFEFLTSDEYFVVLTGVERAHS
ncbi:MAG TPA: hypothetical protein VIJ12_06870 [Candidatus Baltobacteraceae bacterium]